MRMNVTELKFDYRDKYIDMLFKLVGQKYRTSLTLSYAQWDFVVEAMSKRAPLQIGDFALMDGLHPVEFFSDGIRIYGHEEKNTFISFPFENLRAAISLKLEEVNAATLKYLRWKYWPKTKIMWDERIDKSIVAQVWPEISKWIRRNRNVAANSSDGQLCVVHFYPDGREGWTQEKFDKGERPSFYWEIVRYRPLADMPDSLRETNLKAYRHLTHLGREYIVDTTVRRNSDEWPHYGLIMNGGLIWHPNRNADGGKYSIHT